MARSSGNLFTNLGVALLVVMAGVQIWQLDRIEGRLVGGAAPAAPAASSGGAPAPSPSTAAADCTRLPYWKNDLAATAEPGNILTMPRSCLVDWAKAKPGGTLRRIWGSDPNGMSIYGDGGNSADVRELYRYFSNRLAYRDQPEAPETWAPELAEYISYSEDHLTITVRLRKGVKWHTPQVDWASGKYEWLKGEHELVADDFLFPLELVMSGLPATKKVGAVRSDFVNLAKAEKVDEHTFRLVYTEPDHANLTNLIEDLEPFPRWLYGYDESGKAFPPEVVGERLKDHWYNDRPIGTGPFRFVEWKQAERIVMEKNPDYWGEPVAFDKVELKMIADKSAWTREFQNQNLDLAHILPNGYRTDVKVWTDKGEPPFGDKRANLGMNPYFAYFYVGWNLRRPLFTDVRVRQALTYALDRQSLLDFVYAGLGTLIAGPVTPLQKSCYDESVKPLPYDLDAARKLLAEAGWTDTDKDGVLDKVIDGRKTNFEFRFLVYAGSQEWTTIANQMVESYKKIGIKVTPEALEWPNMQSRMQERDFDAYSGSWSMGWEYTPYNLWHSATADKKDTINYIGFKNPELDPLIEDYAKDFDESRRAETCRTITRKVSESYPYTFLFARTTPVLYWDWVNPFDMLPDTPNRDLRRMSFNRTPGT